MPLAVAPTKVGAHFTAAPWIEMGPGFRRGDKREREKAARLSPPAVIAGLDPAIVRRTIEMPGSSPGMTIEGDGPAASPAVAPTKVGAHFAAAPWIEMGPGFRRGDGEGKAGLTWANRAKALTLPR